MNLEFTSLTSKTVAEMSNNIVHSFYKSDITHVVNRNVSTVFVYIIKNVEILSDLTLFMYQ